MKSPNTVKVRISLNTLPNAHALNVAIPLSKSFSTKFNWFELALNTGSQMTTHRLSTIPLEQEHYHNLRELNWHDFINLWISSETLFQLVDGSPDWNVHNAQIPANPTLRYLSIGDIRDPCVNDIAIALFEQAPNLQTFSMEGSYFDGSFFEQCQGLQLINLTLICDSDCSPVAEYIPITTSQKSRVERLTIHASQYPEDLSISILDSLDARFTQYLSIDLTVQDDAMVDALSKFEQVEHLTLVDGHHNDIELLVQCISQGLLFPNLQIVDVRWKCSMSNACTVLQREDLKQTNFEIEMTVDVSELQELAKSNGIELRVINNDYTLPF